MITGARISTYVDNCFLGRYAFPGFGFLMLFYAFGLSGLEGKRLKNVLLAVMAVCFLLQYRSELSLEYDAGLEVYEEFFENEVTPEDVIIGPYTHTIFLNVYHPDSRYYLYGYKSYTVPFANTEALTDHGQLADVTGNIWYICFDGGAPDEFAGDYTYEEALRFDYMYYKFVIYRLTAEN